MVAITKLGKNNENRLGAVEQAKKVSTPDQAIAVFSSKSLTILRSVQGEDESTDRFTSAFQCLLAAEEFELIKATDRELFERINQLSTVRED